MADMLTVTAKCIDKAFDSRNAIQYYPGDIVNIITDRSQRKSASDIDLSDQYQRRLVWLKTLGGRWVFEFDRANSSNTALRIFFCKECGQPFDKLSEIGTHANSLHNKTKGIVSKTQAANSDEEEEQLLALRRAAEEAEASNQVEA